MELKGIKGPTHKVVEGVVAAKELRRTKTGLLCQLLPFESLEIEAPAAIFSINLGANFAGPTTILASLNVLM